MNKIDRQTTKIDIDRKEPDRQTNERKRWKERNRRKGRSKTAVQIDRNRKEFDKLHRHIDVADKSAATS